MLSRRSSRRRNRNSRLYCARGSDDVLSPSCGNGKGEMTFVSCLLRQPTIVAETLAYPGALVIN
jgi:hypothetical protein